jgi:hypothetical protein
VSALHSSDVRATRGVPRATKVPFRPLMPELRAKMRRVLMRRKVPDIVT